MERRDFLKSAAVGVAATAIVAPAVAATPDAAVRWRLLAGAGTAPGVTDVIDIFARELASLTGGGFQVERISPGSPISPGSLALPGSLPSGDGASMSSASPALPGSSLAVAGAPFPPVAAPPGGSRSLASPGAPTSPLAPGSSSSAAGTAISSSSSASPGAAPPAAGAQFPPPASPPGAFDLAASGAVDIAHGASSDSFGKNPAFAIGSGIPYGLSGRRQSDWLFQGGGTEALNGFFANYNVYALPLGSSAAAPMGGWYRREIRIAQDLRGLKVNVGGLAGMVMARLGVVLHALPAAEVAAALASGAIDGAEWPLPETAPGSRLARFRYGPGLVEGGSLHLFINLDRWNALPPLYRSALAHAAVYADRWEEARAAALARATVKAPPTDEETRLRAWPVSVLKATEAAARTVYAELSAANPDFRALASHMMAFRDDAFLSWQVAQYRSEIDRFTAAL